VVLGLVLRLLHLKRQVAKLVLLVAASQPLFQEEQL
jgi:hypothetical protein